MIEVIESIKWNFIKNEKGEEIRRATLYDRFNVTIEYSPKSNYLDEDEYFITIYDTKTDKKVYGNKQTFITAEKYAKTECEKLLRSTTEEDIDKDNEDLNSYVIKSISNICSSKSIRNELYRLIYNECSGNINEYFGQIFTPSDSSDIDSIKDSIIDYLLQRIEK